MNVKIRREEFCKYCSGSGAKKGSQVTKCSACHGSGMTENIQRTPFGMMKSLSECQKCNGRGEVISEICLGCGGKGKTNAMHDVPINIPAGVEGGMTLSMPGEGGVGTTNGPRGDLLVTVNVLNNALFTRDGTSVHTTEEISYIDAILGKCIMAKTVDGPYAIEIPPGTQPGQKFRIKSKGIPRVGQLGNRGDQYVNIKVTIPTAITSAEMIFLEKLRNITNEASNRATY